MAQAGRRGAVTISTNMAGRGTDILLGGNPEGLAAVAMESEMFDRPLLVQLAYKLLSEGEAAARDTARKNSKLTEDLVDSLLATKERFATAMDEIEQVQIVGHLARVLQEPYGIDYNDLLEVLRRVRGGQLAEARVFVESLDTVSYTHLDVYKRQTKNKATLGLGRGKDVFLMAEPVIPIWGFIGTAKPAPIQYKGEPAAPTRLSGHYDHNFHNRQGLLAKADTEFTESHRAHREKTISLNPLCNSVALCALCVTLRVLFHPCHRS